MIISKDTVVALYTDGVGFKNFDDSLIELKGLRPVVVPSPLAIERAKAYLEGI